MNYLSKNDFREKPPW